ncbi:hypothetical protein like AT5G01130 [Hibiscus trionum]|uniref:DUF674 domain-containing protein n=1 Tax=Hibiscus trionum TaxID=183268 RepID=A0A9W7I2V9_HIBTR|nr:hypothetical protein like AT5G01130 [Hibiscus trionum]
MASTTSPTIVSLKLMIDPKSNRLLFAEAGKDFVDFLFYIMSLPVGTVIRLLGKQGTVGSIGNIYSSIEKFGDSVMLSAPKKDILLKPMLTISPNVAFLLPSMQSSKHTILYKCDSSSCKNVSVVHAGGVHYMIMDDLAVMPMSATSIITLLNKFNVKDVGYLKEEVITVGVTEGVELLRASMQSKTVLSSVFLEKKESSSIKSEPTH